MRKLNQEALRNLLHYDQDTGVFTRNGKIAGTVNRTGYIVIRVKEQRYMAHRLAWLYVYGRLPDDRIDHINGNKSDNRISNPRETSMAENKQNIIRAASHNKTGFLGVSRSKKTGRYSGRIVVNGKFIHLGYFDTPEKAHEAYVLAKRKFHPFGTL